jgi:hypothetical protein
MTSAANTHTSGTSSWDEALALYRGQLSFYLDCLIECDCSDRILAKVEAEVRSRSVPDEFKLPSMVRIMVQLVIEHMRDRSQTSDARHASTDDARSSTSNAPKLGYRRWSAILRQRALLVHAKPHLLRRHDQAGHWRLHNVAKPILRIDKVIAGIEVAVVLHGQRRAAGGTEDAQTGFHATPHLQADVE